jgi:hypothetical protein
LCRRCTHRKLLHFKTSKRFSWTITNFELWHSCRKWAIWQKRIRKARKCHRQFWIDRNSQETTWSWVLNFRFSSLTRWPPISIC